MLLKHDDSRMTIHCTCIYVVELIVNYLLVELNEAA